MIHVLFIIPTLILVFISYFFFDHTLMFILSQDKPYLLEIDVLRQFLFANRALITIIFFLIITVQTILQIYILRPKSIKIPKTKKPQHSPKTKPGLTSLLSYNQIAQRLKSSFNLDTKNTRGLLIISAICIVIASLSYNFLSRDFFSYIFWAKVFTIYKQNPYLTTTEAFRNIDWWVSFVHWTHNSYQYGPVYLLYSSIPFVIFGANRFILTFYFIKLLNAILFFVSGWLLYKIRRNDFKVFSIWFFNPFLYIELLFNSHNELLMIFLFYLGIYFYKLRKTIPGLISLALSIGTKYVSVVFLPLVFLKEKLASRISFIALIIFLSYLSFKFTTIQAWYYSWIFFIIPFLKIKKGTWLTLLVSLNILVLTKYLPFIRFDNWSPLPINKFLNLYLMFLPLFLLLIEYQAVTKKLIKRTHSK